MVHNVPAENVEKTEGVALRSDEDEVCICVRVCVGGVTSLTG